jgi:hypothetical protein
MGRFRLDRVCTKHVVYIFFCKGIDKKYKLTCSCTQMFVLCRERTRDLLHNRRVISPLRHIDRRIKRDRSFNQESMFQELFVPINTKGEMYEVCPDELSPAEWEGDGPVGAVPAGASSRAHRLPHLLRLWPLPARVRLLAGTVPIEMAHDVGGKFRY